jgi:hypothetical protein
VKSEDELEGLVNREAGFTNAERAERRGLVREKIQRFLAEHVTPPMLKRIVDDRVFLLGLDHLYRERMKRHESAELLTCARAVAATLLVSPADVPIEGYYWETKQLTEYFCLVRGLRAVDAGQVARVAHMPEFKRLLSVVSAPLYGRPVEDHRLLPAGHDPLGQALIDTSTETDVSRWTLDNLVEQARRVAIAWDDFSLVGLAAFAGDRVVLAALRESVALYNRRIVLGMERARDTPVFVWRVNEELARRGARFVATFNELFGDDLPEPVAENAGLYFEAADEEHITGRCISIARTENPERFYHWAIRDGEDKSPTVEEFWDSEIWTTERYRFSNRRAR